MASILVRFPKEILENVAFYLATLEPLGPPSDLIPLLCVSREIYAKLSSTIPHNRVLYARIFRAKFDWHAAQRRYGRGAVRPASLIKQLRIQSRVLQRFRRATAHPDVVDLDLPTLEDDFRVAFMMMLENDGRNQLQLEWAGLPRFLEAWIRTRMWTVRTDWPEENAVNAFGVWLMWFMTKQATVESESRVTREEVMALLRPFMILPCRYPAFHLPDNHYNVPIATYEDDANQFPVTVATGHGYYPLYREPEAITNEFPHYITRDAKARFIATPIVRAAAALVWATRREVDLIEIPGTLPRDRAHAIALGRNGPTQANIQEFRDSRTAFLPRPDWDWYSKLSPAEQKRHEEGTMGYDLSSLSARWDRDWARLSQCWNPFEPQMFADPVFSPGSLCGLWQGRLLQPNEEQYRQLIMQTHMPENFGDRFPFVLNMPLYMRLREHHCVSPSTPVACGGQDNGIQDGVLNAWLPSCGLIQREGELKVTTQSGHRTVASNTYTTWEKGKSSGHDPDACTLCRDNREAERERRAEDSQKGSEDEDEGAVEVEDCDDEPEAHEAFLQALEGIYQGEGLGPQVLSDDMPAEDFSGADFTDARCQGIQDFILTGETDPEHSLAWGSYKIYGRVRLWDGLICLVREPTHDEHFGWLGRWVLRGYLHGDQNFVGTWRTQEDPPWEGPFTMSKRPE